MSGHSKWNNIKRKKEKTDGQRAKIFTKIGREMAVCVKAGGADPASNGKLRDLIAKAKSLNVPNDNIQRIIKKAEGGEKENYESIVYEGYGPSGIAMIVETLTDNRNRTAGNLRHYFDKFGGNLGNTGCVSFLFTEKGVIVLDVEDKDEESVMEDAFEAGAEDFDMADGVAEITTTPADFSDVREALEKKGYTFLSADVAMVPSTRTALTDPDDLKKMTLLLDHLDDDDDVQNVWNNMENEEDLDR
jgi:YebC/PmpR family DNA-binding regulatory protein